MRSIGFERTSDGKLVGPERVLGVQAAAAEGPRREMAEQSQFEVKWFGVRGLGTEVRVGRPARGRWRLRP